MVSSQGVLPSGALLKVCLRSGGLLVSGILNLKTGSDTDSHVHAHTHTHAHAHARARTHSHLRYDEF